MGLPAQWRPHFQQEQLYIGDGAYISRARVARRAGRGGIVANIKSAEKRWRQSLKRRMRNRGVRTTVRTHIKTVNRSLGAGEADDDALKQAIRALDKAAE